MVRSIFEYVQGKINFLMSETNQVKITQCMCTKRTCGVTHSIAQSKMIMQLLYITCFY